jgi:GGDEF domain-containing protein
MRGRAKRLRTFSGVGLRGMRIVFSYGFDDEKSMEAWMENLGGESSKRASGTYGRVLNRDLFLFLLDLEVKRALRYQNFLCLMLLKVNQFSKDNNGGGLETCHNTLTSLLAEEVRESDIIGSLGSNKIVILLPYADMRVGANVKSRFEDALRYYDFKEKGFEILVDQICFPIHGTDTMDLVREALGEQTA